MGEKLVHKYGDEDEQQRNLRIEKAREKDTLKAFVGMRLQNENQRLMELSKRLGGTKDFDPSLLTNALNGNSFNLGRGQNLDLQLAAQSAGGILSTRERGGSHQLRKQAGVSGSGMSQAGQSIAGSLNSKFPQSTSRDAFNEE